MIRRVLIVLMLSRIVMAVGGMKVDSNFIGVEIGVGGLTATSQETEIVTSNRETEFCLPQIIKYVLIQYSSQRIHSLWLPLYYCADFIFIKFMLRRCNPIMSKSWVNGCSAPRQSW